jgi:hypothetical protein
MEAVTDSQRALALDAVDALNDLVGDLVAGTRVLADYHRLHKAGSVDLEQMSAVQKMCLSHLVLAFAKLLEFWEHYHQLVPDEHRSTLKELNATLRRRGADEFRNTVAGHIWDRKLQRPLHHSEVMSKLDKLVDGAALADFLRWINNTDGNAHPATVVGVIEAVRDSLVTRHAIEVSEVIDR